MGKEISEAHAFSGPRKKTNLKQKKGEVEPVPQDKRRKTSSALLDIPEQSFVESLLVCKGETNGGRPSSGESALPSRPSIGPVPESSVLEKLRQFLPAMKVANDELSLRAREDEDLDIEVITGGEDAPHILMDVALGVADLRTPEAVAAAERAIKGGTAIAVPGVMVDVDESDEEESDDEPDRELLLRRENGRDGIHKPRIQEM